MTVWNIQTNLRTYHETLFGFKNDLDNALIRNDHIFCGKPDKNVCSLPKIVQNFLLNKIVPLLIRSDVIVNLENQ